MAMSAPTGSEQELSRREEMSISGAAMSGAPWGAAVVTGGVVAVGDLGLHLLGSGLGAGRAIRWARSNPWRFAVLPAVACAVVALVLSVVTGGGMIDGVLSGLWHGGVVYGLTGVAGVASKSRKQAG